MSEGLWPESNGGEGNRTPVRETAVEIFYTLSRSFNLTTTTPTGRMGGG